jgi:VCBS repeat protein
MIYNVHHMKAGRTPLATALVVAVVTLHGCGLFFGPGSEPKAPKFDPPAGTYNEQIWVTINASDGQTYVTTDPNADILDYQLFYDDEAILVTGDLTIKAYCIDSQSLRSPISQAVYQIGFVDSVGPTITTPDVWQSNVDYFGYDIEWTTSMPDGTGASDPSDDHTDWYSLQFAVYASPNDDIDSIENVTSDMLVKDWYSENSTGGVGHAHHDASKAGERRYINVFVRDEAGNVSSYGSVRMESRVALDVYVADYLPMDTPDDEIWMNPADSSTDPVFVQEHMPPVQPLIEDTYAVALADLNGDGYDDLIACYENGGDFSHGWFQALGNGTFAPTANVLESPSVICHDIEIADMNNDGVLEIVMASNLAGNVAVYNIDGDLLFSVPVSGTDRISVGDINSDGFPDIAAADTGTGVTIWLNESGGGVSQPDQPWIPEERVTDPEDVLLADLDGDGDADLVVASEAEKVELYHSDGVSDLIPKVNEDIYWSPQATVRLAAVDWNEDGLVDLIFGNDKAASGQSTQLLLNDGMSGYTVGGFADSGPTKPTVLVVADMNGDGRPDLVEAIEGVGFKIWLNDGGAGFMDGFSPGGPDRALAVGRLK